MAFYNEHKDHTNFQISFTSNPKYDFGAFAQGYNSAANILAKKLIERGSFADYDAYPVVFLYRHAFELRLKDIIYWSARILAFKDVEDIGMKLHNTHNLVQLSKSAQMILFKTFPDDSSLHECMERVDVIAQEYSVIDPDSYSYRYPISTKGDYSTRKDQSVNMSSLSVHMDDILGELETVKYMLNSTTYVAQEVYEAYLNL